MDFESEEVLREMEGLPPLAAPSNFPMPNASDPSGPGLQPPEVAAQAEGAAVPMPNASDPSGPGLQPPEVAAQDEGAVVPMPNASDPSGPGPQPPEIAAQDESAVVIEYMRAVLDKVGAEKDQAQQFVYLGTAASILPETAEATNLVDVSQFSAEDISKMVRDSFDSPLRLDTRRGGRPRSSGGYVDKIVVKPEKHQNGKLHYHWAVKLFGKLSFLPAKTTMRMRHQIATHWSCSHTHFYSALRYLTFPSPKKPEQIDLKCLDVWTWDGRELDLFAESQEPFQATAWRRRREEHEREAAGGPPHKKSARFSKIDFTALVIDKGLKTPAQVLAYFQDYGSAVMQDFGSKNQRRLKEFLQDADEWAQAREQAKAEREGDWAILCRHADMQCPHGTQCPYAKAVAALFDRNKHCLNPDALAVSIRAVINTGPSKTTRIPTLVGPTNSGKTTLVACFDDLYGKKNVHHKPALKSRFALRNMLKDNMRLLWWDDFRPVEYAKETIPVTTMLSLCQGAPFEVQVSQSFNDGNVDFEWRRGAIWTAKADGLWTPEGNVTAEDVKHIQSRVDQHLVTATVKTLKATAPCSIHMSQWIRDRAAAHDAKALVQQPLVAAPQLPLAECGVEGLSTIILNARLPGALEKALEEDLVALGAVHVAELGESDVRSLRVWAGLKHFEQSRLLAAWGNMGRGSATP